MGDRSQAKWTERTVSRGSSAETLCRSLKGDQGFGRLLWNWRGYTATPCVRRDGWHEGHQYVLRASGPLLRIWMSDPHR
jgi:hypothetical protein